MSTPQNQQPNSKAEKIANFDPSGVGDVNAGLFGLPFTVDEAEVVVIPVPWEVTVSYSAGTANGPEAVFNASPQIDLFEPAIKDAWKVGIAMEEISEEWHAVSDELRGKAEKYITWLEEGQAEENAAELQDVPAEVNAKGEELLQWLKEKALNYMDQGKAVCLLGGDHSTPLGLIHAMAERHEEFGILQLDAHADLRVAYEGFKYSHASIMYNALQLPQVKKLVQVGIRDLAQSEAEMAEQSNGRITMFYDAVIKENLYAGESWKKECKKIIAQLPQKVYLSFDIDALDPKLCPGTGTPVPGGLEFEEAVYLIKQLVKSGREIIGCDLNEVGPGETEWNGNVGARMLYKICNWMAVSQGRLKADF
ncbi:agmatinase family protein [Pontibacter sp. Tf4]|uniref:agmatinase family protein n=1 Tax=Pontibacter sp. Tf4 TaxID=2761620 RepID=UPI001623D3FB|nr:agmatinase family protein [Pontibacter sp. Tf4]MBB6610423.1 agmatinase family protein [Pontibacter sp. Tf4]